MKKLMIIAIMVCMLASVVSAADPIKLEVTNPSGDTVKLDWDEHKDIKDNWYRMEWGPGNSLVKTISGYGNNGASTDETMPSEYTIDDFSTGPWTFRVCLASKIGHIVDESSCSMAKTINIKSTYNIPNLKIQIWDNYPYEENMAKIGWNQMGGLSTNFDAYHIKWNKGSFLHSDHAKSWVTQNYYNLKNLEEGPWTFQVCLSKNKVVSEKSCGNIFTLNVKGKAVELPKTAPSNSCVDTDGGKDYYKKGKATKSGWGGGFDYCVVPGTATPTELSTFQGYLAELHCDSTNVPAVEYILCKNGYSCFDGACVKSDTKKLHLAGSNKEPGFSNLDWNDIDGLGTKFDKYNVRHNKGTSLQKPYQNAWISFGSYYNLGHLENGPNTFQVCLSKNKVVDESSCSNTHTVWVDGVYSKAEVEVLPTAESVAVSSDSLVLWGSNNEPGYANIDWYDVNGMGSKFDVYAIKWNKGTTLNNDPAESFVDWSYYNLGNLENGPWTFQVCLKKGNVVDETSCSNIITVHVDDFPYEVAVEPTEALVEYAPSYQGACETGCFHKDRCVPTGTRFRNGEQLYCNWNGEMHLQSGLGASCQNNYECSSNTCLSSVCTDLEAQLLEQQNLLEKILHWIQRFF